MKQLMMMYGLMALEMNDKNSLLIVERNRMVIILKTKSRSGWQSC